MGKLIISGNGKENDAILHSWVLSLAVGAIGVLFLMFVANHFGYDQTPDGLVRNNMYNFVMGVAALGGMAAIVESLFKKSRITSSFIDVHENGIRGKGVQENFPWAASTYAAMSDFQLEFEQIEAVEAKKNAIIIRMIDTSDNTKVAHKCYSLNPQEIYDTILRGKENGSLVAETPFDVCACGHVNFEELAVCDACGKVLG